MSSTRASTTTALVRLQWLQIRLVRLMPGADPAHIQAGGDWHRIEQPASRVKVPIECPGKDRPAEKIKVAKAAR
jgi:hypothetical protein